MGNAGRLGSVCALAAAVLLAAPIHAEPQRGAVMIVSRHNAGMTQIPYPSMAACERARARVQGPPMGTVLPNGAILGPPAVTFICVPR